MQQFIVPVNNEALARAVNGVFGDGAAEAVFKAYKTIDEAMVFGFQAGRMDEATKVLAEREKENEELARTLDIVTKSHEEETQQAFDDGYIGGVTDARVDPEEADAYIEFLMQDDSYDLDDGGPYNEDNVSDSGDESDATNPDVYLS